jgi:hypothetical protein
MLSLPRNGEDPVIVWSSDRGTGYVGFNTNRNTSSISVAAQKNKIITSYCTSKHFSPAVKNYSGSFTMSSGCYSQTAKTVPLRFIVNDETNTTLNAGQANDAFFACNEGEAINIIMISNEQGKIVYRRGSHTPLMTMEKFRKGIYVVVAQKTSRQNPTTASTQKK